MIAMLRQQAIRIRRSMATGKVGMTSFLVIIPSEASRGPVSVARPCETKLRPTIYSKDTVLDWHNQPTDGGIIFSARVASSPFNFESEATSRIRMVLSDQQLRALAIDLVKASMIRGIQF